ncbi:MAG: hypothetical protein D6741_20100 [Planctomycetota bacterium]|nr:MAG: hypothetical protein D6741_20100 [Planctomycetota bacterium]
MRSGQMIIVVIITSMPFLLGCPRDSGRPKTYPVEGVVTLNGEPVEGATVVFSPVGGGEGETSPQAAQAKTDADGHYELSTFEAGDGAIPGEYAVIVTKYDVKPTPGGPELESEEGQMKAFLEAQQGGDDSAVRNLLPAKYANAQTSGLKFTVKLERNSIDIKLEN